MCSNKSPVFSGVEQGQEYTLTVLLWSIKRMQSLQCSLMGEIQWNVNIYTL